MKAAGRKISIAADLVIGDGQKKKGPNVRPLSYRETPVNSLRYGLKIARGLKHLVLPCFELIFKVTRQSQTLHVLLDAALNENVA
jgi:hypothetical protein